MWSSNVRHHHLRELWFTTFLLLEYLKHIQTLKTKGHCQDGPEGQTDTNFAQLWLRLAQNCDPGTMAIVTSVQILCRLVGFLSLRIMIIDNDSSSAQTDAAAAQTPTCSY